MSWEPDQPDEGATGWYCTLRAFGMEFDESVEYTLLPAPTLPDGRAILAYANLNRLDLSAASLGRAVLFGAEACFASFDRADLGGANLHYAKVWHTSFVDADLRGADMRELEGDGFQRANFAYDGMPPRRWADFSGADLSGADLTGAKLYEADFRNAVLDGATFDKADLRGCIFAGASMIGTSCRGAQMGRSYEAADLRGAALAGADFTDAVADSWNPLMEIDATVARDIATTTWPAGFDPTRPPPN